jgi:dTDP-glucose 4,6-dehydratase/UDP-glucuronate decarboxylase
MSDNSNDIFLEDVRLIAEDLSSFYDELEGKTILVAGGKGFLGTYFVNVLNRINKTLSTPMKIVIMDNLITSKDKKNNPSSNITFLEQDISEGFDFQDELHYIIHAASIAAPPTYRKFPIKTVDVNYQGTRNLLEIARKKQIKSMLFLSSSEIYGDPEFVPTPESYVGRVSCTGPRACYDESKRLAETISVLYFQQYKVPVKIARPFNVYGPYLNLNDGRIIPDFMRNAIKKSEIIVYSDGSPTRSFCYVSDAMRAFFRLLFSSHDGIICNVGNDEEISVNGVTEMIQKTIEKPISVKTVKSNDPNYTKDNPQRRCPDLSLIKKSVNYTPKINFEEGLKRVYKWYKGNLE